MERGTERGGRRERLRARQQEEMEFPEGSDQRAGGERSVTVYGSGSKIEEVNWKKFSGSRIVLVGWGGKRNEEKTTGVNPKTVAEESGTNRKSQICPILRNFSPHVQNKRTLKVEIKEEEEQRKSNKQVLMRFSIVVQKGEL